MLCHHYQLLCESGCSSLPADHFISPPPLVLLSTGDAAGAGNASQLELQPQTLLPCASCLRAPVAPTQPAPPPKCAEARECRQL